MSREEIINDVYKNKTIHNIALNWVRKKYIKESDLTQFESELLLVLCEMPENKLKNLYSKNELVYYMLVVARNQATNYSSNFNKLFRDKHIEYVYDYNENILGDNDED